MCSCELLTSVLYLTYFLEFKDMLCTTEVILFT